MKKLIVRYNENCIEKIDLNEVKEKMKSFKTKAYITVRHWMECEIYKAKLRKSFDYSETDIAKFLVAEDPTYSQTLIQLEKEYTKVNRNIWALKDKTVQTAMELYKTLYPQKPLDLMTIFKKKGYDKDLTLVNILTHVYCCYHGKTKSDEIVQEEKDRLAKHSNDAYKAWNDLYIDLCAFQYQYKIFYDDNTIAEFAPKVYNSEDPEYILRDLMKKFSKTSDPMENLVDARRYLINKVNEEAYNDYLIETGQTDDKLEKMTDEKEREKYLRLKQKQITDEQNKYTSPEMLEAISLRKWDKSGVYSTWQKVRDAFKDYDKALKTLTKENYEHDYKVKRLIMVKILCIKLLVNL